MSTLKRFSGFRGYLIRKVQPGLKIVPVSKQVTGFQSVRIREGSLYGYYLIFINRTSAFKFGFLSIFVQPTSSSILINRPKFLSSYVFLQ